MRQIQLCICMMQAYNLKQFSVMITYIKIDGFKSFQNFEMDFTPLTVIAGSNAAGKSNLFDALKLLSALADTDKIQRAFREQRGELLELFTKYDDHSYEHEMSFIVDMLLNPTVTDTWGATEKLRYTRLRYELKLHRFTNSIGMEDIEVVYERLDTIKHKTDKWIKMLPPQTAEIWRPKVTEGRRQIPYIYTGEYNGKQTIIVPQDGSQGKKRLFPLNNTTRTVLSSIDSVDFKHILAVREEMKSWKFMQLNPEDLRLPTSKAGGEDVISASGKNLAAALYRIKLEDKYNLVEISRRLHSFLPNFVGVDVMDDVENKRYVIVLHDVDKKEYTSRVLSEGTLRILALCVLCQDDRHSGLLCFEEPENGIHPFRIKTMVSLLKELSTDFSEPEIPLCQIIVNTHSVVFVKEMRKWMLSPYVSINFAQMVNRITSVDDAKKKLLVTKITPVPKEEGVQMSIPFTEQEKRMTLQMIEDYLRSDDNASINIGE